MHLLGKSASVIETMGLDEAYLDMSDVVHEFDEAHSRALEIKRRVSEELGLVASVGVASCKIVAKVASDYDKPDGLVIVLPATSGFWLLWMSEASRSGKSGGEPCGNRCGNDRQMAARAGGLHRRFGYESCG
jgi:hypothetical protein